MLERAQHRCQVPGCRSSKHLTIHHVKFFSHGGTHDPSNLVVLCDGHHRLLHDGLLQITGRAPDGLTFMRNGVPMRAMGDNAVASARALLAAGSGGRVPHAMAKHRARAANASAPSNRLTDTNQSAMSEDSRSLADQALRQLGFKAAVAARAVEAACAHVGVDAELGVLIKEALRHCS